MAGLVSIAMLTAIFAPVIAVVDQQGATYAILDYFHRYKFLWHWYFRTGIFSRQNSLNIMLLQILENNWQRL